MAPLEQLGPLVVGGMLIGLTSDVMLVAPKRRHGQQGSDYRRRKKRNCARCIKFKGANGLVCLGRIGNKGGSKVCQYFSETGTRQGVLV